MSIEGIHPLESGLVRRKARADRRPGFPIESPFVFYPRYFAELVGKHVRLAGLLWKMFWVERAIRLDPKRRDYMDTALTPPTREDLDMLEMFQVTEAARTAATKAKRLVDAR
jgi:hypothetical protein